MRARKRVVRRVSVLVAIAMLLSVAPESAYASERGFGGIRLSWASVRSWFAATADAAARLPEQAWASAAGRSHTASTSQTRSGQGNGKAPGKGAGALGAYTAAGAKSTAGASGKVASGFSAKTSVRNAKKSTAQMDYFVNADGSITKRIYQGVQNYKTAAGAWEPIDNTLKRNASGRLQNTANSFTLTFRDPSAAAKGQAESETTAADASAGASASPSDSASASPAATVSAADGSTASSSASATDGTSGSGELATVDFSSTEAISWSLQGAADVSPSVDGEIATYSDILPDTSLRLISQPTGVKEEIVLASASAGNSWTFPLALTGVSLVQASDGTYELVDASGNVVANLPQPSGLSSNLDKSGEPVTTFDAAYSLATVNGVEELTLTLDSAWLDDSARVFPVTVDPTIGIGGTTSTTYVSTLCTAGCTEYSDDQLKVGFDGTLESAGSSTQEARSFLDFPGGTSSAAPFADSGYRITAAQFAGFRFSGSGYTDYVSGSDGNGYYVESLSGSWSPTEKMVWDGSTYTAPSLSTVLGTWTGDVSSSSTCSTSDYGTLDGYWTYTGLDTSAFNSWSTGGSSYDGLGLAAIGESNTDGNSWSKFGSDNDTGCSPYLSITESLDDRPQITSMSPSSGSTVSTLTPTFTATGTDADSWPYSTLDYEFALYSGSTGKLIAKSGFKSGVTTWTVPSGDLSWGQTYTWRVQAYDGENYGDGIGYSSVTYNSFTTTAPPPVLTDGLSQNTSGKGFSPSIGNYTTSATDASVATYGPALAITRDYNSLDYRVSQALGAGWSSLLDARATQVLDGSGNVLEVVMTYPDGSQVAFGRNSEGTYNPPEGRFAKVTFTSGTGYTLVDDTNVTYTFAQTLTAAASGTAGVYGLSSITDANGNIESLSWTSGKVTQVTSASGRALYVTWSGSHVSAISTDDATSSDASTAQTWTYNHTGDQLTSVCTPGSECTNYTYTQATQYQNAVLDTDPTEYWRFNQASGSTTAVDSVLTNESADDGTYHSTTLGSTLAGQTDATQDTATFDGSSSYIWLPAEQVLGKTYVTISLWFKTGSSGPLFCEQNEAITSSTTPSHATCSLYVGTDGKLRGELYQGAESPITSSGTVNDGKTWHNVVLSASATTQAMYLDGALVGTLSGTVDSLDQNYNYVGAGYSSGEWADTKSSAGDWYFTGSISDVAVWNRGLSGPEASQLYKAGTTATDLLRTIVTPAGVTTSINYGSGSGRFQSMTDSDGGTYSLALPKVTGSSQVFASAVLGAAPQGYWRLNDSSSATVAANEVNGGTAAYNNVTLGATGKFSDATATTFDGSTSYAGLPTGLVTDKSDVSISLWFKTSTSGPLFCEQSSAITSSSAPSHGTCSLYVGTDGKLRGEVYQGSASPITSSGTVDNGAWHFVTLAASGTTQALYLDGALVGTLSGTVDTTLSQSYEYVGAGYSSGDWADTPSSAGDWHFTGSMSDVAVYPSGLSDQEAVNLYTAAVNSKGIVPVETETVTDPNSKTLTYEYDPANGYREISETDGTGATTTYGYDTSGFLYTVTDPNGNVTTTQHDVRGNVTAKTTCQVQASQTCSTQYWTYYPDDTTAILSTASAENNEPLTYRDARSSSSTDTTYETKYIYNSLGLLAQTVTPSVQTDAWSSATDRYSAGSAASLDSSTKIYSGSSFTDSDGTVETAPALDFALTHTGTVFTTTTTLIPSGLLVISRTPGGGITHYYYYTDGDLAETVSSLGQATYYIYDGLGRVTWKAEEFTTVLDSSTTEITYTPTTFTYTADGQVLTETDPTTTDAVTGYTHEKVTTDTYTSDGLLYKQVISDAGTGADASRTTITQYNGHDEVQQVTDPDGNVTSYTYDAYGNKQTVADPDGNITEYTYDDDNRLETTVLENYQPAGSSTAADLTVESRAYDPAGRLASVTDAMDRTTEYTYTDNGLVASKTVCDSTLTNCFVSEADTYDAAGNLTKKVTNGGVTETDYTFDTLGRVVTETDDPSAVDRVTDTWYTADSKKAITTATNADSTETWVHEWTYDVDDNVLMQAQWGDGRTVATSYTRDTQGLVLTQTDPMGKVTTYSYNALGQKTETVQPSVTSTTMALGSLTATSVTVTPTTLTGYDTFGDQEETEDANGNITTKYFDGDSNITEIKGAAYTPYGSSTAITPVITKTYDGDGNVLSSTTPLNETTTYSYDQLGDVATSTDGLGLVTHKTYDADKELLTSTSPGGTVTAETYDYLGRKATTSVVESALSETLTTTYTYSTGGWLWETTSPAGVVTTDLYDNLGESISKTDGAGNTTTYTQDGWGRVAKTTLADGTYTTKTYDNLGDVTATASYGASGTELASTSAVFDLRGLHTSTTNALGVTEAYGYDALGHLISESQPTGSSTISITYGYDQDGNKTYFLDGDGNATYWTYNSLNLQEAKVVPAVGSYTTVATRATINTYDANGQLTLQTLPGGVTQIYTYDADGNILTESGADAEGTTYARVFTYTADGQAKTADTCTDTSCGTAETTEAYTYDSEGHLLTETGSAGSSSFTYTVDGLMATRTDSSGTSTYTYDSNDRLLTDADAASGQTLTYRYNTLNQLVKVIYSGGDYRQFTYDSSHRLANDELLTSAAARVAQINYAYDAAGELTSKTEYGISAASASAYTTNTYAYDTAGRLLTWAATPSSTGTTTTTTYVYDAAGNRTSVGSAAYTYDARNELTSDGTNTYTYTARGTEATMTTTASGIVTTYTFDAFGQETVAGSSTYTYDALGRTVAVGAAALTYSGQDNLIASDGTATYSRDSDGTVTGVKITSSGSTSNAWTDLHTDVVGRFGAGSTGMTAWTVYDPLGNVVQSSGTQLPLGYQSGYTDPGSGQVNMDSRWYSPSQGQFTSSDTEDQAADPNTDNADSYAYGDGSPMVNSDPSGHLSSGAGDFSALFTAAEADLEIDEASIEFILAEASLLADLTAAEAAAAAAAEVEAFVGDVQIMVDDLATELNMSAIDVTINISAEAAADMTAAAAEIYLEFIFETFLYWIETEAPTTTTGTTGGTPGTGGGGGGKTKTTTKVKPKPIIWMTPLQAAHLSNEGHTPSVNYNNYIGTNPVDLAGESTGLALGLVGTLAAGCSVTATCTATTTNDDNGDTCLSNRPSGDGVENSGSGWIEYDPTGYKKRATGAEACITSDHNKFDTNARRPANWAASVRQVKAELGLEDNVLASCHNIPAVMGGSNTNKGNLTACVHLGTNIDGYSMRWVEAIGVLLADEGFVVDFKVTDDYSSSMSTIPTGYSYVITTWLPDGSDEETMRFNVDNEYEDSSGKTTNIGN